MGNKKPNTLWRYYGQIALIFIILFIGIVWCVWFLIHCFGFSLNKELSINDLVMVFVTIFLAIIIPITIGRTLENRRLSRELLIQLCEKAQCHLTKLHDTVSNADDTNKDECKINIFHEISRLWMIITQLTKNISSEVSKISTHEINQLHDDMRIAVTESINNNDFTFSTHYKNTAQRSIDKLNDEFEDSKFLINRY